MEFFIARKSLPIFEIYRQCRIALTKLARSQTTPKKEIPYHIRRYIANHDQVPLGHFSILQELTIRMIGPLEMHGYDLPANMLPDGSVGKLFCKWLRDARQLDPKSFPSYDHKYEDGRVVPARLYPLSLLPDFVAYLHEDWLPNRAPTYFEERDETALDYLPKLIQGPATPKTIDS
jgi:hypothetical protein